MFNKEGYKVNAYYVTKKLISGSIKMFILSHLLTFDNLHQGPQIFHLKICFDTLIFISRNHDSNYQIASCFLFTKSLFYNFLFTRYITTKSKIQLKSWISQIKYKVLNEYEAHIKDIKYEDEYEYGKMMIKLRSHNIAK